METIIVSNLNSFLNSFVSLANIHSISLKQLEAIFPHFFDDSLQRTLQMDIARIGLVQVVQDLRQMVCSGLTLSQCHEKLDAYKLDHSNLLFSIYTLKGFIASAHPDASETEVRNMTRIKSMTLLPAWVTQESRRANREVLYVFFRCFWMRRTQVLAAVALIDPLLRAAEVVHLPV